MRRWRIILAALAATLLLTGPAKADPVSAAITGLVTAVQGWFAAGGLQQFLVKVAISSGLSMVARAFTPTPRKPGISTDFATSGGDVPRTFILGKYATAGHMVCPPMSHGKVGKTPNAYLNYVIALGCLPGMQLSRVIVDGAYVSRGTAEVWGRPLQSEYAGFGWIDYLNGNQLASHAQLLATYATMSDRPWSADMVGKGVCYAVATFRFKRTVYSGLPQLRFEMLGIPVYDPRADDTLGGTGAQRWDNPATWAYSDNLAVLAYNVLRGIPLPDGTVWGGGYGAAELPAATWFAAMSECDVARPTPTGTRPQYAGGIEIALSDEPAEVIEQFLRGMSGQIADCGYGWKVRVGAPAAPVLHITDDDILIDEAQAASPFPSVSETWNAVTARYPEPGSLWEAREAVPLYNPAWEAEDGSRRLIGNLDLPAVSKPGQVQALMRDYARDGRRWRTHTLPLPATCARIELLDTITWTSERFGYDAKVFEVTEIVEDPLTLVQMVAIRERDPADYSPDIADETAPILPSALVVVPAPQSVPNFAVAPAKVGDSIAARRPAIRITWDGLEQDDVTAVRWSVRLASTTAVVAAGASLDPEAGETIVTDAILSGTDYEVRARLVAGPRDTTWTAWTPVSTPVITPVQQLGGAWEQVYLGDEYLIVAGSDWTTRATVSLGPMAAADFWVINAFAQIRVAGTVDPRIRLQRRLMIDGVWEAWTDEYTHSDIDGASWKVREFTQSIGGLFDDVEYRLQVKDFGIAGGTNGYAMRRANLAARKVVT